ncbi:hypothetical protein TRP8649_03066 [Pelagimonas phthalicica]|uniref:Glycosyl transferase family 2 n=1 Tax=Pelagimonas phthalicica TaxID=1037362 RepID=A0A238JE50_9RHOB|nr:hypothetical protein [Pelagimonas phthalicica]TDS91888.1 hypothetical protein CLV87_3067 [Pelagimonas phthalicica]SMX28938.1 hypothetical protein TRP8649_03066 [Pelagimonas phthalicica]
MAQAPATSKPHRFAMRLAAHLGLTNLILRLQPVESEIAALELRAEAAHVLPSARKQVTFLIPLVGPHHVGDWEGVVERLNATLQCLLAQDNPNWQAVICCQERPALPDDPRIHYLPFDDPEPGNDKWRKLAALCDALPKVAQLPGYVMSFDADDLLRQGVVGEMLTRQAPGGYLVEAGYVMDAGTGVIALADRPTLSEPLRKPFWKLCGSCAAVAYDPALPGNDAFLRAMTAHEHRMFPYLADLAGHRLAPLGKPAVLYVLNHGENFGARRGRVSFKTRFVERFQIEDPDALAEIAEGFPQP